MLPGIDGLGVCRKLKNDSSTLNIPIVMLTAKGEETDIIVGLELGADDYIVKPFSVKQLIARIKAVLRRTIVKESGRNLIRINDLVIDSTKHEVILESKSLNLTFIEFELLKCLTSNPGRVFTRDQLLNNVWGEGVIVVDRTVDVHIRRLRKKMKSAAERIVTVRELGYKFKG